MKHQRFLVCLSVFSILFCLAGSLAFPQRLTGIFRGTVKDDQGEILPGVMVEIESPALIGGKQSMITTATGSFLFASLAPGTYTAKFSLTGFQGVKRENIVVSVGKTVTIDIALKQAGIEETVNVIGAAPVVDVTKSGTSTTYDQKLLDNLPKTRFTYMDIMFWAPGVSANETGGEEWHSSYGSDYSSDNYQVDGVDTSFDYNGTTWVWNNPDIYQEGEVIAIGAPAEYGGFQGAVVNVVTKSGGNQFHAELSAYIIPSNFVSNNVTSALFPADVTQFPFHIQRSHDIGFELSGPVMKDKFWFYGNYQYKRYDYSQLGTDSHFPTKAAYDREFVKFTIQLAKSLKVVASYQYEKSYLPDVITPNSPFDATAVEPGHYYVPNLMVTSILGANTILDLKVGGWYAHDNWLPMDGHINESAHYDVATQKWSKGIWSWDRATGGKFQANASLSHYADNFIKGNHEFKTGVQYTKGTYGGIFSYSGGVAYKDYNGAPYYAYFQNPYNYGATVNRIGAFFDDAWSLTDRLTLNLGLRFDHQDGDLWSVAELDAHGKPTGKTIPGINNAIKWNNWSPRLGFVYQLTNDKKTILRANYGQYYAGLMLRWFFRLSPSAQPVYAYMYDPATQKYDQLMWVWNPTQGLAVDPNVKNSVCHQFSIGMTRELVPNLSLELTYLYKYTTNLLSWWNSTGQFEAVPYLDAYTGKTITVYNQTNDPSTNVLKLENRPEYKQKYQALIVAVQKRLSNKWQLSSSFVISKSYGVSNVNSQLTQGSGFVGIQNPNDLINNSGWSGRLQSDRPYMFKLQGSYFLPLDLSISASFQAESGKPIARTIPVIGMNQGTFNVQAEPRGSSRRLDPLYDLDLRIEKKFQFTERFGFRIAADLFNVFNANTMIETLTTIGTAEGFMMPSRIVPPRRIQIDLRIFY
jgi:hypothetical protein